MPLAKDKWTHPHTSKSAMHVQLNSEEISGHSFYFNISFQRVYNIDLRSILGRGKDYKSGNWDFRLILFWSWTINLSSCILLWYHFSGGNSRFYEWWSVWLIQVLIKTVLQVQSSWAYRILLTYWINDLTCKNRSNWWHKHVVVKHDLIAQLFCLEASAQSLTKLEISKNKIQYNKMWSHWEQ